MKKIFALLLIFSVICATANAQYSRYIVRLKDKGTNPFSLANPSQYLGPRALQRRLRYNIPVDSTDLPVTPRYIDSLRLAGAVTILNSSKWLNQVAIKTTDAVALAKINSFPFVISTTAVATKNANELVPVNKPQLGGNGSQIVVQQNNFCGPLNILADVYNYGRSHGQVALHNGQFLHNHGFRGEGMQMVILDAGFFHYQTLPTFDSVRNENRILGTWDFVANETSVNEDDTHGMECFSTIAANIPGLFVGTAPKTSFYLYRTEDVASEFQIEEQNYAAGLERADSIGVDISSGSLGYYSFDNPATSYTYADLNGDKTITARAVDYAAQKGIMVVAAAGNEGTSAWHFIITPADADSVMAVAAVDTLSNVAAFSSYGPTADGRIKPNLAAVGRAAVVASPADGNPIYNNGTSFACPNLAGLTTCLMQAYPEYNNMTVMDAMERSATRFSNPDNRIGYGIPDMKKAFVILQKKSFVKQNSISGCSNSVQLQAKFDNSMRLTVERKLSAQVAYSTYQTFNGSGNFSVKNLSFTDDLFNATAGTVMYRFKMDIVGDTSFYFDSLAVAVPTNCAAPENSIRVNPNPVVDQLNVIVSRIVSTNISLMLTNARGQLIYTKKYVQPAGAQVQSIDMRAVSGGVYFLTVFADNKKLETQQVLKK